MASHNNDPREQELAEFCNRYILVWLAACVLASFSVGWPVLVAWAVMAWVMKDLREIMIGD